MERLAVRRWGALLVFASLLASINLVAAPSALAHHPEISATSVCDVQSAVIDYVATSWAEGAKGSNADIGIYVDGTWVAKGSFESDNGYTFSGRVDASAWVGKTVTVTAQADGPWGNGKAAGDSRSTTVTVASECGGTTVPQPETPSTTIPGTYVPGNPKCADLGYDRGVKSDPPGTDEIIDGISFDYHGLASVTVSSEEWTILAVIVKGGNGAQVYTGSFVDLVAPLNHGGQQADISHVDACVGHRNTTTTTHETTTTTKYETTTTTEHETTTTTEAVEEALVWINVGRCEEVDGESLTPVWVRIEPAGSAVVTLRTPDGPLVFTESGSVRLGPGRYFWDAVVEDGYELVGRSEGSFRTANCSTNDTMVVVRRGSCSYDESTGLSTEDVRFQIAPGGTSTVVVEGPGGPYEIDGSGETLHLVPGTYTWEATAEPGHTMMGTARGTFTVDGCGPTCSAAIGDTVWLDMSPHDGRQSPGEDTLPGVGVELLDGDGHVLAATTTDEDGRYLFSELCPGTYRVRFELPDLAGLDNERWTVRHSGEHAADSDPDDGGLTDPIVLDEGVVDLTWDAGIVAEQVSSTTVTSLPPTSTTEPPTTSTTVRPTTSTTLEILPGTTTTVPPVTATTLPFTGFEMQMTALIGAAALMGGAALLAAARRREETDDSDHIGAW